MLNQTQNINDRYKPNKNGWSLYKTGVVDLVYMKLLVPQEKPKKERSHTFKICPNNLLPF